MSIKKSVSFSSQGQLTAYGVGVASYIYDNFELDDITFYGTSGGSLAALFLALKLDPKIFDENVKNILIKMEDNWYKPYNTVNYLVEEIGKVIENIDISDLNDRLNISCTKLPFFRNEIINKFEKKDDIINAISASCCVPVLFSKFPSFFNWTFYIDGFFSKDGAKLDDDTIIVSPYFNYNFKKSESWYITDLLIPKVYTLHKAVFNRAYKDAEMNEQLFIDKGWKKKKNAIIGKAKFIDDIISI